MKIIDKLSDKHSVKYTIPQLRLWAKFIQSKRHDSYDEPPKIPLITGTSESQGRTNKDSLSEVVAGAATAIVRALKNSPKKTITTPPPAACKTAQIISPISHANLRRKHLEDLRMLHHLYDDGILSCQEYQEQKQNILSTLRELNITQ